MRNSLKRTLAAVSVAAMAFTGVAASAMTASAEGAVELSLDQVYAEPGETVVFAMNVANNATNGWASAGFKFDYDERLTLGLDGEELLFTEDIACLGLTYANAVDTSIHQYSATFAGSKVTKKEGILFTVEFTVPEDAEPGDVFPIELIVDKFNDDNATPVEYTAESGWIAIAEESTTTEETTTTTTTEDTTTTTTTTTTTEKTTTTTTSVTAPPVNTGSENTAAALGLAGLLTAGAAAIVLKKKNN